VYYGERTLHLKQEDELDCQVEKEYIFRFAVIMFCVAVNLVGPKDLDKFVAFIGSFAW
jgi:hypothetical protein